MKPEKTFFANFWESESNSQGGRLIMYEDKITFQAHRINFGNLSEKTMLINEIVKVEKGGSFIDLRLHIHDSNGRIMVLTTWSRDKIINFINIRQNKTSDGQLRR